jgi:hypothetical protein
MLTVDIRAAILIHQPRFHSQTFLKEMVCQRAPTSAIRTRTYSGAAAERARSLF